MKKVMLEFPVIGYAEVVIEVEDDMDANEILAAIADGDIVVEYDGRSYAENLIPLEEVTDARYLDIPQQLAVVE